jgi:Zn finger protein HypA/HybF involved in hydrogenase expression
LTKKPFLQQGEKTMFSLEQIEAASYESTGFCISCHEESGTVEPDARKYACEACGERAVYGADEIIIQFPEMVT